MKKYTTFAPFLLFFAMMCVTLPVQSQEWIQRESETTGDIYSLAAFNKNTVVAAVWKYPAEGMITRSADGGDKWTEVLRDVNLGFTGATTNSSRTGVICGGTTALALAYRTTNSGLNWEREYQSSVGAPAFWCASTSPDGEMYTGGGKGVIGRRTALEWQTMQLPSFTGDIIDIHYPSKDTAFLVESLATMDWVNGRHLHRTTNGGQSWTKIRTFGAIQVIRMINSREGVCAGGEGGTAAIWRTNDAGLTWKRVYTGATPGVRVEDIAVDPNNPYVLTAVGGKPIQQPGDGFILISKDGGRVWTVDNEGLESTLLCVLAPSSERTIAAGTGGYLYTNDHDPVMPPTVQVDILGLGDDVFRDTELGAERVATGRVICSTPVSVEVGSIVLEAHDSSFWKLDVKNALPVMMSVDDPISFDVTYLPKKIGTDSAYLVVRGRQPSTELKRVLIRGNALVSNQPSIQLSLNAITFDTVLVGAEKIVKLIVSPKNSAGLGIESALLKGTLPSGLTVKTSKSLPVELGVDEELEITVRWSPTGPGELNASLQLISNDDITPEVVLGVTGIAKDGSTSVASEETTFDALLYPNPARSNVTICNRSGQIATVLVFQDGRMITRVNGSADCIELNTSGLSTGAYTAIAISANGRQRSYHRFVVH